MWWAAQMSHWSPLTCALAVPTWLMCHLHPTKTQSVRNLCCQGRVIGSHEPTCSLNQIYSPLGTLLGSGMFIVPFVGCCHSLWGWGEECPRKVSPGYIRYMMLPLPAPSEPVVETPAACPASAFFFSLLNAFLSPNIKLLSDQ